jgi:hypothetical protein
MDAFWIFVAETEGGRRGEGWGRLDIHLRLKSQAAERKPAEAGFEPAFSRFGVFSGADFNLCR